MVLELILSADDTAYYGMGRTTANFFFGRSERPKNVGTGQFFGGFVFRSHMKPHDKAKFLCKEGKTLL